MSNNRKDNVNSNYIYPQPYIDPMLYLNPYYSNAIGYKYNSQEYQGYNSNNNPYIDYSQFNDAPMNNEQQPNAEYTNIPDEADDYNIPSIPDYLPNEIPSMILPNINYNPLPPNMTPKDQSSNPPNMQNPLNQQNTSNQQNTFNQQNPNPNYYYNNQAPYMPNVNYPYFPMFPAGMFPNMYPVNPMMPNMMFGGYPFPNMPNIPNINIEEFDEEEM